VAVRTDDISDCSRDNQPSTGMFGFSSIAMFY